MECAVIEFARNVIGWEDANSTEISADTKHPVIAIMEENKKDYCKKDQMRIGKFACDLKPNSKIYDAYNKEIIYERHRHKYEFNNEYKEDFVENGMKITGINPETGLVEVIELDNHPWFVGVQFHPEFKSTVATPHPLFINFVKAMMNKKNN